MKESMSVVLSEHPVLAGRLRRDIESDGYWEVKYNDAGVRLVQASLEMKMNEFMELEDREEKEGVLDHWTDVDLEHPEISAFFNIQSGGTLNHVSSKIDALLAFKSAKKWHVTWRIFIEIAYTWRLDELLQNQVP